MKKTAKIILSTSLSLIGLATLGVSTYYLIDYFLPAQTPDNGAYNDVVLNLEKQTDSFDVETLKAYKENTATMFVGKLGNSSGSMGTIWNYGYAAADSALDSARHYFATNIHVVSSALKGTANNFSIDYGSEFDFKSSRYSSPIRMQNVRLEKINIYKKLTDISPTANVYDPYGLITYGWYSDFVILSTTTPIFVTNQLPFNFLDTDQEYNWLAQNMKSPSNLDFYICGYPASTEKTATWPDVAIWTTVKYKWKTNTNYYGTSPTLSTSGKIFGSDYFTDPNPEAGQTVDGVLYKNFANQLVLPKLNLMGGSSGSLVTVKYYDEVTKKDTRLAIGIYWGGYSSDDSNLFLGGVDLFYSSRFEYINSISANATIKIDLEYNDLLTIN